MLCDATEGQSRREFLRSATGGVLLGTAAVRGFAQEPRPPDAARRVVDTHTHFYDPTRPEGVPWPSPHDKLLYRRVLPAEYRALAAPHGVVGTIVVEASPWLEDNQWLLDLAAKDPFLLGIVGNLSPGSAGFRAALGRFVKDPLFRGIRIGHAALREGLDEPSFLADVQRLAAADLELDVNGGPELPADVARLAAKVPELRIVINHLANVEIDGKSPPAEWQKGLRAAAAQPNVFCKVSALVEGASRGGRKAPVDLDHYVPVLDAAWDAFGEDRLIYGSNWPVSERAAPYAAVQGIVAEYFQGKGREAADKFFFRNSQTAYKWAER